MKINLYNRDQLVQTIPHASIIWQLLYIPSVNQLFSFGEDGIMRVFSPDKNQIQEEKHLEYIEKA